MEETLSLVRTYQLPNWQYFGVPELDPYRLAGLGYRCSAPLTLQCSVCRHQVVLSPDADSNPEEVCAQLAGHDEHCLYYKAAPLELSQSGVYMGLSDLVD